MYEQARAAGLTWHFDLDSGLMTDHVGATNCKSRPFMIYDMRMRMYKVCMRCSPTAYVQSYKNVNISEMAAYHLRAF